MRETSLKFGTSGLRGLAVELNGPPAYDIRLSNELDGIGPITGIDTTDGVRLTLALGEIIHYRASGNAPELRCYVEAKKEERAAELLALGFGFANDRTKAIESR